MLRAMPNAYCDDHTTSDNAIDHVVNGRHVRDVDLSVEHGSTSWRV